MAKPPKYTNKDLQRLAIAGYNMGPSALTKILKEHKTLSYDKVKKYLPKETQDLVEFAESNRTDSNGVEMYQPLLNEAFDLSNKGVINMSNLDLPMLSAHIYKESYSPKTQTKYDLNAYNPSGAKGLGQFTPITINEFKRLGWLQEGDDPYSEDKASELILKYQDHMAKNFTKLAKDFRLGGPIPKAQGGLGTTSNWLQGLQQFFSQNAIGQPPVLSGDKPGVDHTQFPIINPGELVQPLPQIGMPSVSSQQSRTYDDMVIPNITLAEKPDNKSPDILKKIGNTLGNAVPILGGMAMNAGALALGYNQQKELSQQSMLGEMNRLMKNATVPINKGMNASMLPYAQKGLLIEKGPSNPYEQGSELSKLWEVFNSGNIRKLNSSALYKGSTDTYTDPETGQDQFHLGSAMVGYGDDSAKTEEILQMLKQGKASKPNKYGIPYSKIFEKDSSQPLLVENPDEFLNKFRDISGEQDGTILTLADQIEKGEDVRLGIFRKKPAYDSSLRFDSKDEASKYATDIMKNFPAMSSDIPGFDIEQDDSGKYFVYQNPIVKSILPRTVNIPRTPEELAMVEAMGFDPSWEQNYTRGGKEQDLIVKISKGLGKRFTGPKKGYRVINNVLYPTPVSELSGQQTVEERHFSGNKPLLSQTLPIAYKGGGSIPSSSLGQWKYPRQIVNVPSNNITMQGINHPNLGIGDNGMVQMMFPGMNYKFPGAKSVIEIPMLQYGGAGVKKYQAGDYIPGPPKQIQQDNTKTNLVNPLLNGLPTDLIPTVDGRGYWSPSQSGVYDAQGNLRMASGQINPVDDPFTMMLVDGSAGLASKAIAKTLGKRISKSAAKNKPSDFVSEIDWAKWNKEIPENTALMQEYNAIEQITKANGTWMKNPDGSAFTGSKLTKEQIIAHPKLSNDITDEEIAKMQFLQQQSQNFKNAFSNSKLINDDGSPMIVYHGSAKRFDTFDESKFQLGDAGYSGKGIYTTPSKTKADSYALSSASFHSGEIIPTTYELYGRANKPIRSSELPEGYDLFDFYREKNWQGNVPIQKQLRDYDAAIANKRGMIDRIYPDKDAAEIVFPTNKQLKSAIGNNGMFDMTKSNIYKTLLPGLLGLQTISNSDKKYQAGGRVIDPSLASLSQILTLRNQNIPWVNRALSGNTQAIYNNTGQAQTHLMGYDGPDRNGSAHVFPTLDMTQSLMGPNMLIPTMTAPAMKIPNMRLADFYTRQGLIKH